MNKVLILCVYARILLISLYAISFGSLSPQWEIEFAKWTEGLEERFIIYNVGESLNKLYREKILQRWIECGGIVLISDSTFRSSMKHSSIQEKLVKPDAIVLDER